MSKNNCQYCPKKFQSLNDLDRHLQKIHGLSPARIRHASKSKTSEQQSLFINQCLRFLEERKHDEKEQERDLG